MLSDEESLERFEDSDANEDGKITWDEILQDNFGSDPEDLAVDDKLVENDKTLFNAADINNDGYLDSDEFKAFSHPEETPRMLDIILKHGLDEHDKDKDNYVSFQEYLGDRADGQDKEFLVIEKDKFDHVYDKNSDGKLSINEIQNWLVPSNE